MPQKLNFVYFLDGNGSYFSPHPFALLFTRYMSGWGGEWNVENE